MAQLKTFYFRAEYKRNGSIGERKSVFMLEARSLHDAYREARLTRRDALVFVISRSDFFALSGLPESD